MRILLGPAGSPARTTLEGIKVVRDLGLDAMEISFTHGIHMGIGLAKTVGKQAKEHDISLSIHAPYYINLASEDKTKIDGSRKRILDTCERGHHMGARKIIFHTAYYGSRTKEETMEIVKNEISKIIETINEKNWDVQLLPETAGKISQFGDLDELLKLSNETGCGICIDPAHLYARNQGRIDFREIIAKLKKIGNEHHFHFSGINYGPRGERNHVVMGKPSFEDFAKELLKNKMSATIISESPITWQDSIKMKGILSELGFTWNT